MTVEGLLPCPFCGGKADVERNGDRRQSAIVVCLDCGCRLESNEHGSGHDWNQRAAQTSEVKEAFLDICENIDVYVDCDNALNIIARALGIER